MTPALLERCQQAASSQHLTVEAWAVRTLEQAAPQPRTRSAGLHLSTAMMCRVPSRRQERTGAYR
jgi:hypothetical protein